MFSAEPFFIHSTWLFEKPNFEAINTLSRFPTRPVPIKASDCPSP